MLESLVASLLNRVLGSYVENFDSKKLQIGLLSGDVKLSGLKLKRSALDSLQLPIDVTYGHIGTLVLQIPYSNLKSKPVKVFIENVYLLSTPESDHSDVGEKRREMTEKMQKLKLWEISSDRAMFASSDQPEQNSQEQQNFTSSLVTKIIENLQVTIRNIHLRFEDKDLKLSMGATLNELSAVSTNDHWEPAFISNVGTVSKKLVTLDSLAFYMDPEMQVDFCNYLAMDADAELLEDFQAIIFDNVGENDIIRPINGQSFVTIDKRPATEHDAKIRADLKFEELSFNLAREQYVDVLKLTDKFQRYFSMLKIRNDRPKCSVHDDPMAWFRYAANHVVARVREKQKVWTWEYIKNRLDDQHEYVELYKQWCNNGGNTDMMSAEDQAAFDLLEQKYSYDDLVLFRSIAKRAILAENAKRKSQPKIQNQSQTWSEWLWGSKNTSSTDVTNTQGNAQSSGGDVQPTDGLGISITEDQRQELLDMLDVPLVTTDAANQKVLDIDFYMRSASVRLKDKSTPLVSAGFDGVKLTYSKTMESFRVGMEVMKFSITDLTHKTRFSNLIEIQRDSSKSDTPFSWLLFEHHPSSKEADSSLFFKLQSVSIVHNAQLLDSVVTFFQPPPDQNETMDAILLAANKTVEELREQTRIGLEYALENHKTLNLQIDVESPTIIVPLDPSNDDSAALVLNLGTLGIGSELVPASILEEVKSKQALQYSDKDWARLASLMYDRFTITLQDTQILLGQSMSDIERAMTSKVNVMGNHFIDKTTLVFSLELSIVPQNVNFPKVKMSIHLPTLRTTLSDVQYKLFMSILSSVMSPSQDQQGNVAELDGDGSTQNATGEVTNVGTSSASTPSTPTLEKSQKIFDLEFVVSEAHFFVVKNWDAQPLIDLDLTNFKVHYWSVANNAEEAMGVDLTVKDLLITEHLDNQIAPELRKVAESHGSSTGESDLFVVKYRRSSEGHQRVSLGLSKIQFVLNQDSVLTIYDYIMSTFASPAGSPSSPESVTPDNLSVSQDAATTFIDVEMNMMGLSVVICENHYELATLTLGDALLNVNLSEYMKLKLSLGNVSLVDRHRNDILSIEGGGNLADIRYETGPSDNSASASTPYSTSDDSSVAGTPLSSYVYVRLAAVRLNVVEDPLIPVLRTLNQFNAMKSVYDQARMMASNESIQVEPANMHFDIIISTPIIVWSYESSWLRLNLGEIYLQNEFKDGANKISSGIRDIQVSSSINDVLNEIIHKCEFSVLLDYVPDINDVATNASTDAADLPITSIRCNLTPIHVHLSEIEFGMLIGFTNTLSKFSNISSNDMQNVGDLRRKLAEEKKIEQNQTSFWWGENFSLNVGGNNNQLNHNVAGAGDDTTNLNSKRPKTKFSFDAPLVDIELVYENVPFSLLAMRETHTKMAIDPNSNMSLDFYVRTFSADDLSKEGKNKFPQIVPPVKHDGRQVLVSMKSSSNDPMKIECSIDSPQVILALEYAMTFRKFVDKGYALIDTNDNVETDELVSLNEDTTTGYDTSSVFEEDTDAIDTSSNASAANFVPQPAEIEQNVSKESKRPRIFINIVDMSLTVLADESNENSEAIVFKIEHLLLNAGETMSFSLAQVGVFLTRMQSFETSKLRIIDDFNVAGSLDSSESSDNLFITNAQLMADPLVLRISAREIGIIMNILQKASGIYAAGHKNDNPKLQKATTFSTEDHRVARLRKQRSTSSFSKIDTLSVSKVLSEHLVAEFQGLRLVLIDHQYQLPMTDFCIKPFKLSAKNWSESILISTKFFLYINTHSFAKSAWEPLLNNFEIELDYTSDGLELNSGNVADIDFTPETVKLLQEIKSYFDSSIYSNIPERDEDGSPYRIVNETGIPVQVWQEYKNGKQGKSHKILNGEEIKWSFHDWRLLREDLSATDQGATLGLSFLGREFTELRMVPVNKIGEHVYTVYDGKDSHRLVFDISVIGHLKRITIRSTVVVHNETDLDLELLVKCRTDVEDEQIKLGAHSSKPLPLCKVESDLYVGRPPNPSDDATDGDATHIVGWSEEALYWKNLKNNTPTVIQSTDAFYLSVIPVMPESELCKIYPYMALNITAPFQIVNNLPVDFQYCLYNREIKRESKDELAKAGRKMVYNYNPNSLLMLRVDILDYVSKRFAVVNVGSKFRKEFYLENELELFQEQQNLSLMLQYVNLPNGKGRLIIVYAPYVIRNSSGHELTFVDSNSKLVCPSPSARLWSFAEGKDSQSRRVHVFAEDSTSSLPVSFDATGSAFEVEVLSRDRRQVLYLGGKVTQGTGRYATTKIVDIAPRFIICNSLRRPIDYHEPGGNQLERINPDARQPVGFVPTHSNKEICIRFGDSSVCEWSSSFAMSNVGTSYIRISERGKPTVLVKVEVVLEDASLFVHLSLSKTWPFSIRNFTESEFVFYQSDPSIVTGEDAELERSESKLFQPVIYRLPPRSAMPYSWDFPSAEIKQLIVEPIMAPNEDNEVAPPLPSRASVYSDDRNSIMTTETTRSLTNNGRPRKRTHKVKRRVIQLSEIGELPPANFGNDNVVDLSVIADGIQQALVITPHDPDISHYDSRTNEIKRQAVHEMEDLDSKTALHVRLNLKGVGLSFVTNDGNELLYLTLHNVNLGFSTSETLQSVSLIVQWIQIDNMLPGSSNYPVVLYPTVLPKAAAELAAHPCFSASLTKVNDDTYGLTYIKHATLLLQEITIEADEDFLLALVKLVISHGAPNVSYHELSHAYASMIEDNSVLCGGKISIPEPVMENSPDIYFEQLHLQPIQLNLSFVRTGSLSTSFVFKDNSLAGNLSFVIDALTMTIGSINDAPVRFNALLVDNIRTRMSNLTSMIQIHYQQEFLYQLHKIVGSADIIGNPVGLFNNISSGVIDLFYEPYLGYTLSDRPQEFGVGLAKGGISFMKKSVFGLSDSFSKVTGSLSKGLASLTMDSRFQAEQRSRRVRNKPRHAVYGVKYGIESFYESVSSGFSNLAEAPMQGAVTDGSAGFFKGLGKGLFGLPAKTTIGLLDLVSNVSEGIRNTTTVFDTHSVDRVRLPRVIFEDGVLRPYCLRDSVGQMILHSVRGSHYAHDQYLAHTNITKNKVVVVSMERVLVASIHDMNLEWSVKYSEIASITLEPSGISIMLLKNVHGPFIPLPEESTREYIYKNVAKGVEEFNRRRMSYK